MGDVQTFKPDNLTISDLLKCDETYRIPNYQRQYSWTNEQLEELWDDLYDSYSTNSDECYFLGSVVVVDAKGYHDIVDGQQRITTIMIMLNVLLKTFPNINENPDILAPKGNKKRLKDLIFIDENVNRLKLQTDPSYDTIFNNCIINPENYNTLKIPSQAELKKENPEPKYKNTAKFFYDRFSQLLEEKGQDELDNFVNYILFKTNVIKIICTNQSFAIKLFLVLNDRGMPLTNSDIIKSYLLDKYNNDSYTDHDRDVFNNDWKYIEEVCNIADVSMDDFLVLYEYYRLKSNPKRNISEELKVFIQQDEVKSLVGDMRTFADNYKKVIESNNNMIYSLRYIPWRFYVLCCLISAYQVDYDNKDELFKVMRRFFYLCWISGKTLNGVKQTSFNLISSIANKKDISEIKDMLNDFLIKNEIYKRFYETLDDEVYGENFLKPLLFSVEYSIREVTNTTFYSIDNKTHIEHILPQAYQSRKEWSHVNDEGLDYINTLGNMALLLGNKNEEALNYGFDKKVQIYSGEGKNKSGLVGFDSTKKIVTDYQTGDTIWDIDHIKKRKEYLMDIIEDMFDVKRELIDIKPSDQAKEMGISRKWKYNDNYYNNKEFIAELTRNYLLENEITSFEQIPDEIKNCKLRSHPAILEFPDGTTYSYDPLEINGTTYYIRAGVSQQAVEKYIDAISKHFGHDLILEYEGKRYTRASFKSYWDYALPKVKEECEVFANVNSMDKDHSSAFFGIPYSQINLVINKKEARAELLFQADAAKNYIYYALLENHKDEIEGILDTELVWKQDDNVSITRIFKSLPNVSIDNLDQWEEISEFHAEWARKLDDIVVPYLLNEVDVVNGENGNMLSFNRHHFKDVDFFSSLTGKKYHGTTGEDGNLKIIDLSTGDEVINNSNPSKKAIIGQALIDLGESVDDDDTLYQRYRRLSKIILNNVD